MSKLNRLNVIFEVDYCIIAFIVLWCLSLCRVNLWNHNYIKWHSLISNHRDSLSLINADKIPKRQLSSQFYLHEKMSTISTIGRFSRVKIPHSSLIKFPFPIIWGLSMEDSLRFYPRWRFNLKWSMEIKKAAYVYLSINRSFIWETLLLRHWQEWAYLIWAFNRGRSLDSHQKSFASHKDLQVPSWQNTIPCGLMQ